MGISTNAQRVVRIYRGSTKVWEDDSNEYIPIKLADGVSGWLGIIIDPQNKQQGLIAGFVIAGGNRHLGDVQTNKKIAKVTIGCVNEENGYSYPTITVSGTSIDCDGSFGSSPVDIRKNDFGTIKFS